MSEINATSLDMQVPYLAHYRSLFLTFCQHLVCRYLVSYVLDFFSVRLHCFGFEILLATQ